MPSPIGHALGGLIVAVALAPHKGHEGHEGHEGTYTDRVLRVLDVPRESLGLLLLCIVAACLPDVDFAWGRHNMETHSIGFAMLLGLLALAWRRSPRVAVACALAAATHPLLDALGTDDVAPLGVMAFWPFSTEFFYADAEVFGAIGRHYWKDTFIRQNTLAVLRELLILLPILALVVAARRAVHHVRRG